MIIKLLFIYLVVFLIRYNDFMLKFFFLVENIEVYYDKGIEEYFFKNNFKLVFIIYKY